MPGRDSSRARARRVVLLAAVTAHAAACGQPEVETAPPVAALDPDVAVTVTGGEIRGAAAGGNPGIVAFKGVPYAAPPVGDLRWKPPQPVAAWDGVRDAAAPGPICMFHRAISGSTWVYGWDRKLREGAGDRVTAEAQGVQIADRLGASGAAALTTLRAAPARALQAAANANAGSLLMRTGYIWAPNVDGWLMPSDPLGMYEAGLQHDVPLITGMNADEGVSVARRANVADREAFESHVRTVYPGVADELIAHYGVDSPEAARSQIAHLVHDMSFAGPVRVQAEAHASVSAPVWLYHFTRVPPTVLEAAVGGAYHGGDLVYVFGTMVAGPGPPGGRPHPMAIHGDWTETDRRLSETMIAYWTQFAATGNPNRDDLPAWPAFDPPAGRHLELGETVVTGDGLHPAAGRLFRRFAASRRAGT